MAETAHNEVATAAATVAADAISLPTLIGTVAANPATLKPVDPPVVADVVPVQSTEAKCCTSVPQPGATLAELAKAKVCPQGHALILAPAVAGSCDCCGRTVSEGQPVSECRECNWYFCALCAPITECPKGHTLRMSAAMEGKCDGCNRPVSHGTVVSDCRTCNWYLCRGCQPLTTCFAGHELKLWVSQSAGNCSLCKEFTQKGDTLMGCQACEWNVCAVCRPQLSADTRHWMTTGQPAQPLPKCPQGHAAVPTATKPNTSCDQCGKKMRQNALASECGRCNWSLCVECHPIRQCKKGHILEARPAEAGKCDGCGRVVQDNQAVLDCRRCNWYICGACHMPVDVSDRT